MARRKLEGLRILITGASQGIGKSLALAALAKGAHVLANGRSQERLEELAKEGKDKGGRLEIIQADVTKAEDRQKMVEFCKEQFGGLDVLVNNAGLGATGHFFEATEERLRQIMEVNFFALAEMIRIFHPLLKEGVTPAVVNISSIAGKRGIPARSDYSASKFAVQGLSEALRAEFARDDIDVLVVCPGLTQTNFSENMLERKAKMNLDHMRGMTPEAVADHTLRALEKSKSETVLTMKGKLMTWVSRFFPRLADFVAKRKVRSLFKDEIEQRKVAREKQQANAEQTQEQREPVQSGS